MPEPEEKVKEQKHKVKVVAPLFYVECTCGYVGQSTSKDCPACQQREEEKE